jgi:hypothetical protein
VRHGENHVRLLSPQGSPPAADSVGCEARRETCSKRETGTGKLCDQVDLGLHIVGAEPSEAREGDEASDRITSGSPM